MKVLQVTPAFYPATFWGGPIFSVLGLCNALAATGSVSLRVLTTDSAGPDRNDRLRVNEFPVLFPSGYEVYYCRRRWGHSVAPGMLPHLIRLIRWADIVHLTGVYSFPTLPVLLLCKVFRKPVVWSPRGALQRWEKSNRPALKRVWEFFCNLLCDPGRTMLHVTSPDERAESTSKIPRAGVFLIPNGVPVPADSLPREWVPEGRLRLLFIGRLDPKKGLEYLLRALAKLDEKVVLSICGDGEQGYCQSLKLLADELGLTARVCFHGHIDGEAKSSVFAQSDLCVVPSFTENFAMVVAEALAHGVPVIASRGTPWEMLESVGCGLWVSNAPEALAAAIESLRYQDLQAMGEKGAQWVRQELSWQRIAEQMKFEYERMLAGVRN